MRISSSRPTNGGSSASLRFAPPRIGDDAIRAPGADRQLLALEDLLAGGLERDRDRRGAHRRLVHQDASRAARRTGGGRRC